MSGKHGSVKQKSGQASIQEGKSDDTKRAGRIGTTAKTKTTATGTSAIGAGTGKETKTAPAGTVAIGAGADKESKTTSTGTAETRAGAGGETKTAAAGRGKEEKIKVAKR